MLAFWIDLAGLLGFILALLLALAGWWSSRTRLLFADEKVYVANDYGEPKNMILAMTITNMSDRPVSITSASLIDREGSATLADLDVGNLFSVTPRTPEPGPTQHFCSTKLPVNFQPKESQRISFYFRLDQSTLHKLGLLLPDDYMVLLGSNNLDVADDRLLVFDTAPAFLYHLKLSTPRQAIETLGQAEAVPVAKMLARLRARARHESSVSP
jgi:hypothetical protein